MDVSFYKGQGGMGLSIVAAKVFFLLGLFWQHQVKFRARVRTNDARVIPDT